MNQPLKNARAKRIYQDLMDGAITVRTTHGKLRQRYDNGYGRGDDPWMDYKRALRDYAWDHGCFVMVDDSRAMHVATFDCGPETTQAELAQYFTPQLKRYLQFLTPKPARFTIYRLPKGDYSKDNLEFFEKRGDYVVETRVNAGPGTSL